MNVSSHKIVLPEGLHGRSFGKEVSSGAPCCFKLSEVRSGSAWRVLREKIWLREAGVEPAPRPSKCSGTVLLAQPRATITQFILTKIAPPLGLWYTVSPDTVTRSPRGDAIKQKPLGSGLEPTVQIGSILATPAACSLQYFLSVFTVGSSRQLLHFGPNPSGDGTIIA